MNREPDATVKPTCFVLMPIADANGYESGHFGRVYEHLLKPAIIAAGYVPVRADDAVKTDYIVVGIVQKIVESAMVICDYSAKNANVMYELGIRHAFDKPVVLIKDRRTEKIFDIQGLRYTEYDETLRVDSVAKDIAKLTAAITDTATVSESDFNSVVRLAGIKAANVPAEQIISGDTKLLLDAIGALEARVRVNEDDGSGHGYFEVVSDGLISICGDKVKKGEDVYSGGLHIGTLFETSAPGHTVLIQQPDGIIFELDSWSNMAKHICPAPLV